jgi:hypothetical protein
MGHVAIFCDDFETLDGLRVADNIIEKDRAVFLNPSRELELHATGKSKGVNIPGKFVVGSSRSVRIGLDAASSGSFG